MSYVTPEYELLHESYLKSMGGLKTGDVVKVLRNLPTDEHDPSHLGWKILWSPKMDDYVGKEYTIAGIDSRAYSVRIDDWHFPIFVLEKISSATSFKISDDYTAVIRKTGHVLVGVTKIPYDLLKQIYDSATEEVTR